MQLTSLFLQAALAGGISAAPTRLIQSRDLASIQGAISSVQSALGDLDTAVKGLTNDPNTAASILSSSNNVSGAIKQATSTISASEPLSLTDAIGLQQSASGLTSAVDTTISDLVAKKAVFDQLGVSQVVLQSLQQQKSDSTALGDAIVSKVPAIGQGIAQQSTSQVAGIIDKAIATFSAGGAGAAPAAGAPPAAGGATNPAKNNSTGTITPPSTGAGTTTGGTTGTGTTTGGTTGTGNKGTGANNNGLAQLLGPLLSLLGGAAKPNNGAAGAGQAAGAAGGLNLGALAGLLGGAAKPAAGAGAGGAGALTGLIG